MSKEPIGEISRDMSNEVRSRPLWNDFRGTPVRPDVTRKITQGCENTNRVLSSGKSGK
jgi:hypothetical protein